MTGPTTAGSIKADLGIDKSGWDEKAAEAKAEARELGELSPEIKVKADVGPALAKLDEVARAEQRLEVAQRQAANSASTAYIAYERLNAMKEKGGRTDLQLAAATEASARADRNAEAAETRLLRATEALNAAKAEAVRKSLEEAAAAEAAAQEEEKAATKASNANHQRVSGLQVLIGLAPAILSAAAPIAAGAVGLGVAFGVMGGAGVLALKGIKNAMEVGDSVGNQYAAGVGVLKQSLETLGGVSANAMLNSFNGAVGDITAKMPFLNQLVKEGSGLLGQMGGTALNGVLNGLQQMNPLIQQGGVELGKFVTWLFSFTGTNGFKEFLSYAGANLPSVMHLIESLVTLSGRLLAAFAPLGPVVINVLSAISDGLSNLPLPVLAGLATAATAVAPALRIAGTAMALFGVEANLAVPVVGILLAALTGLGAMAITAAQGTDTSRASMENYTQALRDDTNAIGEHVRAQAAKALVDSGATAAARALGVSIADVTAAATGNADALARVKTVTDAATAASMGGVAGHRTATQAQIDQGNAAKILTSAIDGTNGAIQDGIQKNSDYDAAIAATKANYEGATPEVLAHAQAYGVTVQAYQNATTAQQQTALQLAQTTLNMQMQNDAAGLLKRALDDLNGKALSAAQAQNAFDSSLANMGDHISATGKKIKFTTDSIGDMSSASVALRGQLNGQVAALQQVVEANGGLNNSTGEAKAQMEAMRGQIIANAVAHGVDKDAVTAYIDKILQIPASVPPTQVQIDTSQAEAALQALTRHREVQITAITTQVNGGGSPDDPSMTALNPAQHAKGGMVNYLASGGFAKFIPTGTDTVPAMLTPGEIVMKKSSVDSIGAGTLLRANDTGQLPSGGTGPVTVNLILDGQIIDTRIVALTNQTLDGVARQIGGMRR